MTHDEIIECPKSGGNLCYKIQLSPDVNQYLSLSCGFYSNSLMKEGEEFYEQTIEGLPELHKDLLWKDEKTGLTWAPNLINSPNQGMVFAQGTDKDNWGWMAVKAIKIEEEDRKNHPFPGKPGMFLEYKMDMKSGKLFKERDYLDALSHIGILPE